MANARPAVAARNAMLQAILDLLNAGSGPGTVKIYSGSQPSDGDGVPTGTLLVTLPLTDPASGSPSNGVVTFSAIAPVNAAASGTATWARLQDSDGNNVFDGDVRADGNGFFNFNRTDFVVGSPISISSFTLSIPTSISF